MPNHATRVRSLRFGDREISFRRTPLVMGVVNITPDSFSDGGRFLDARFAVRHAHELTAAGADILDLGGESTRPGSHPVSADEELERVMPVVHGLLQGTNAAEPVRTPLSIDTHKPEVAAAALAAGCLMVNDVTAARDPAMVDVLLDYPNVPVVLMHMLGEPRTMQENPRYDDVVTEVAAFLRSRAESLEAAGVARSRIVLDPGIGFGKRLHDNLELLNGIDAVRALGYPVLVGGSRKSFIGAVLGGAGPEERLYGSLAVAARCFAEGVEIVRVHDVRETVELFRVLDAIEHPDNHRPRG